MNIQEKSNEYPLPSSQKIGESIVKNDQLIFIFKDKVDLELKALFDGFDTLCHHHQRSG